jgi:diacylglycerol kinase (ATP)
MRAVVIVNPIAGPGRARILDRCAKLARATLARYNCDAEVCITQTPRDAHRFATAAREAHADLVVAWGGDGTINGAGSALAGGSIPLGIVPGGSGNGLARELGLPRTSERALATAATGRDRTIDAGELNGSLFFNVAGIGLDAQIAERIARPGARRGLSGYVVATLQTLRAHESLDYVIGIDEPGSGGRSERIQSRALFVALANSRQYGNGAQIAPHARLDDGELDLVVVKGAPGWSLLSRLPAFFRGTLAEGPDLLMRRARSLTIRSDRPIAFHVDGEPRAAAEVVTLRVNPGALRVRVPS